MRDDFGSLFAASGLLRADPSPQVLASGLPCGPFDQKLLNELFFTLSSLLSELNAILDAANVVPDETKTNQILAALQALGLAGGGGGLIGFQKFLASDTYIPTPGTTRTLSMTTGRGGPGGGAVSGSAGGGGGSSPTVIALITNPSSMAVTLGSPDSPGTGTSVGTVNGTQGGITTIGSIITITAGQPTTNGSSGGYGAVGGAAGVATVANGIPSLTIPGAAGPTATAYAGTGLPGTGMPGAASLWGGGGSGSWTGNYATNPYGQDGQAFGSGGGGGSGNGANGGAGGKPVSLFFDLK